MCKTQTKGGRKNPLAIDGPESIYKSRAVKDKKWPRFGGPGGVYVKVKEKCKKFPYCNQGDINALHIFKNESLKEAIKEVSKKMNLSENFYNKNNKLNRKQRIEQQSKSKQKKSTMPKKIP